ncbi:MAG: glycosyltransferase family 2 protein [Marinibacterium sp.]
MGISERVTVITVAFGSLDVLPDMAGSLPEGTRLIIVDNGTDDGMRAWAAAAGHEVIVPGGNIGFGAACNQGAARAQTEFLFFLNPDARVAPGAIAALVDAADRHPEAAAFGPEIRRGDGSVFSVNPSIILPRRTRGPRGLRPKSEVERPSLNGAAIFVRRTAFEQVGGFDPEIFLYFEDDDLTLRLAAEAGKLIYVPAAQITHASGGATTPSPALSRFKGYHYARSHILVLRKHGRALPWLRGAAGALRRVLSLRFLTSESKRADALGRVAGTWSMAPFGRQKKRGPAGPL